MASQQSPSSTTSQVWVAFITRLHFYIGLFIGPFIFVAAVTGTLYVLTPQIENSLYKKELFISSQGTPRSLAEQVLAAKQEVDDSYTLSAVRPAPAAHMTTRVMFAKPTLGESESRVIFVNPITLDITGDTIAYGTSGILPFRTTLDYLHRNLLLGDIGRNYSEIAASWLWLTTLGGIFLWFYYKHKNTAAISQKSAYLKERRWHGLLGLWIMIGLLFLSATGLTWSRWAGNNIGELRQQLGWVTPSVSTQLAPENTQHMMHMHGEHAGHGEHTEHHMQMTNTTEKYRYPETDFDDVYAVAKTAGIHAAMTEIVPPKAADRAWVVKEIDRSWPTQVDTVAINAHTMQVTQRADFKDYPLIAKLIRWGVDIHMGVFGGVINQIIMAVFGMALATMVALGYTMWWKKRPGPAASSATLLQAWKALPVWGRFMIVVAAILLGSFLPMMGLTLIVFIGIDLLRTFCHQRTQYSKH